MHPYLQIGKFQLPMFGLMMLCGMIAAFIIIIRNRKYQPYDDDDLSTMAIVTILSGFVGAKLLYWLVELDTIIQNPHFLLESITAGFVFYGALIGGVLGMAIYAKIKKHALLAYTDLVLPAFMVGQGIGRIGCFFAGCCYGKLTDGWFAVTFPAGTAAAGTRIPTQLMECAFCVICGILLMMSMRKEKHYGLTSAVYLMTYGVWRFIIEFFRDDDRGSVGVLSTSQFIGIFIVLAGIALLIIYLKGKTPAVQMFQKTETTGETTDGETVDEVEELSTKNVDNPSENVDNAGENGEKDEDNPVETAGEDQKEEESPASDENSKEDQKETPAE